MSSAVRSVAVLIAVFQVGIMIHPLIVLLILKRWRLLPLPRIRWIVAALWVVIVALVVISVVLLRWRLLLSVSTVIPALIVLILALGRLWALLPLLSIVVV